MEVCGSGNHHHHSNLKCYSYLVWRTTFYSVAI
ncbi:Uncharacterised protein [Vibrio cholerae]|nr:Uncharacterised protein [Vibrio cholerae]